MNLHEKLIDIQQKLKVPKDISNDFGGFKYRNIEEIETKLKPFLSEHKLSLRFSDRPIEVGGRVYIEATAILSDGTDTIENTAVAREATAPKAKMDDAQLTGSCSSYARKYAAGGMFLIDDTKDADSYSHQTRVTAPTVAKTYIDPLGEAKLQLNEALVEAGHDNAVKKKVVIDRVLGKSTVDSVAEAYEVIQAIQDGIA